MILTIYIKRVAFRIIYFAFADNVTFSKYTIGDLVQGSGLCNVVIDSCNHFAYYCFHYNCRYLSLFYTLYTLYVHVLSSIIVFVSCLL